MEIKKTLLALKKSYYIVNFDDFENENMLLDKVGGILKNGADFIHVKSDSPKKLIEWGVKLRELCSFYDALFMVEDRIDVAKILHADGVFLKNDSIPINYAKKILDEDKLIGSYDGMGDYVLSDKKIELFVPVYLPEFV